MKPFDRLFYAIFLFFLILMANDLYSQNKPFPDTIRVDSAEAVQKGLFDKENRQTFKIMFSGKPARAALYSLIIPGGGQIYNKKYWKVPIVWGAVGYFGYVAVNSNNKYKAIDKAYRCMIRGDSCIYEGINNAITLRPYRDQARNTNERNWVTFSVIYLIQVLEAYINRHLIDFDLDEDLSFNSYITPAYTGLGISLNLGKKTTVPKNYIGF